MPPDPPAVWLTTLGCAKNQVDSEKIAARLAAAGYRQAAAPDDADVVMVNTCAFIDAARRESIDTILELAAAKQHDARLMVIGCMAQRYHAELEAELPEVDSVVGLDGYGGLLDAVDAVSGRQSLRSATGSMDILSDVRRPTPATPYAYVKVAEGCDKPCTFCAIPQIRGPQRSRPPVNIREEVTALSAAGVGEVVLVAQDLAAYGRDIDAPGGLVGLVGTVADVPGLRRLRLLYLHPREITPNLIEEIAGNPVVASYFDLSLQHASGRLLRAMKRPGDGGRHLDLIGAVRRADPDAALRSSFIVGFPGEEKADVEELAAFLLEARLDWAGFFPFSPEEGTPAAGFDGRVEEAEAGERLRYLQTIQDDVTAERNAEQIGREVEVLVDMVEEGTPVGRSHREAPEIDGMIVLDRGEAGRWVSARITGAYAADTSAEVIR
jgi:ribosomal protein S12 methylthiotransferase